jgi:DNA-binding NarL/FixJ family response regulator
MHTVPMHRGSQMKLLIVDDNPSVRNVMKILLADIADAICECADGTEAVVLYATERPDFVLMDIQMANMDGITATERIRAIDSAARVIIVTDHDEPDFREAARRKGACGYVPKTYLPELVGLLRDLDAGGSCQP